MGCLLLFNTCIVLKALASVKKHQEKEVKSIHIGKEIEFADNNTLSINNLMESIKRNNLWSFIPETTCEFYSLYNTHMKARCVLYTSNEYPGVEITKQYHLQKH